ncbi:MAG: glycerol-3-phosphate dehydrogenase/oxidase [Gammaproteobacteria bacterium]|nr:MAG: glycerol-3-phosphate dehydrogenase/oxidase [Gammaproteobacteria bacterium]
MQRWNDQRTQQIRRAQETEWDAIVVGGGITGAGIFQLCSELGLKVILLEKQDFAWGTSSKSSKMVHGGLRYLASGDFRLANDAVKERQRLMKSLEGQVDPLPFVMGHYRSEFPPDWAFNALLTLYDGMAGQVLHKKYPAGEAPFWVPGMRTEGLHSFTRFQDAVTDDARLTLNVIRSGLGDEAIALHYCAVEQVRRDGEGQVKGTTCRDRLSGDSFELSGRVVINATGAWTDQLRQRSEGQPDIRPLRGSHLVFPSWRVPVAMSISYLHPRDKRPVFVFPWEGVTVAGTTDLDHCLTDKDASITEEEVSYLLEGLNHILPSAQLSHGDVLSTWAGVRPVVSQGKGLAPSKERREHTLWNENGLVSVAGGKLTTFRLIAADVLEAASYALPVEPDAIRQWRRSLSNTASHPSRVSLTGRQKRWLGRYGEDAMRWLEAHPGTPIPGTRYWTGELGWILSYEPVAHLDDLLLRRTRLGNILPGGGASLLEAVRALCETHLGWADTRWEAEKSRYLAIIDQYFSLPERLK